jgi:hypothetical protein
MVHHPWVEVLRARRSMRVLQAPSQMAMDCDDGSAATGVDSPAAAAADGAFAQRTAAAAQPSALKAGAHQAAGPLQRIEAMLADEAGGVLHSAASSPCLGVHNVITSVCQLTRMAGPTPMEL